MGKQWKWWQTLFSWAPKSLQMETEAMKLKDACSLKEKLDSILKSRDITLPTKVCLVKAKVFLVVMYGCKSWTIKKAECWTIDGFELSCWSKFLRGSLDSKEIKPVSPKGNQPDIHWKDWCWNWSSNTLAIRCKRPTHWKRSWCWERLRAWGEGGNRGWDGCMASLTQWTWIWANSRRWWRTGKPGMLQSMGSQRIGHDLVAEQQQ